jgi:hypothetical protein
VKSSRLRSRFQLSLGEVSALCLRHQQGDGDELLAVGDQDYLVLTAPLNDDELGDQNLHKLGEVLGKESGDAGSGSQWEAIATDAEGRVFVVREDTATVVVFSRRLR